VNTQVLGRPGRKAPNWRVAKAKKKDSVVQRSHVAKHILQEVPPPTLPAAI
jgi:hypothetical protein